MSRAGLLVNNEGCLYARGRLQGDEQVIFELRDLLHRHGVPTEKTEERASLAIKKIGGGPIEAALNSRNAWAALTALGSQPKHNFLWVKPDELEKQIRFRAHSKYKAAVSEKKKENLHSMGHAVNMDPKSLGLVAGTFVSEDNSVSWTSRTLLRTRRAWLLAHLMMWGHFCGRTNPSPWTPLQLLPQHLFHRQARG